MSQPLSGPVGAPCWIELYSTDTDRARTFYGELFGWTAQDAGPEYGGYINFFRDGQRVAGGMHNDGQSGTPDGWSIYLSTGDARATVDRATAQGAQVVVPAMDVMDLGVMAVLVDSGGAAIGAWQPGTHRGFEALDEPGAPAWFELHTRDYDGAVDFYRAVFGWNTQVASDTPEFRYTTLADGDDQRAGIMDASGFLPDGVPAHWSVYFRVTDTDAALEAVQKLGGTVVRPAEDTPYGRLAEAADPTGARFKLIG